MSCEDDCVIVEKGLQEVYLDGTWRDYLDEEPEMMDGYGSKCFNAIMSCNYGHKNYAVMAYATRQGHLTCIKELYETTDVMWHNDLAIAAAQWNQLECLEYIVKVMGDVEINDLVRRKLSEL